MPASHWRTSPAWSVTGTRQVTELVYRKQLRPVMTEGAETMDRLFPRPKTHQTAFLSQVISQVAAFCGPFLTHKRRPPTRVSAGQGPF
jgi:hypothetical protein